MSTQRVHRYPVEIFDPVEAIRQEKEGHRYRLERLADPPVSQGEFARIIDVDRRTVQDYIGKGILHADKDGRLNVHHNVRRFCAYLRDEDLNTVD